MTWTLVALLPFAAAQAPAPSAELAARAQRVFAANCHRCHGQDGASEGGFSYVLDRDRLLSGRKVVPGDPTKSKLLRRMLSTDDPMPPVGESPRPSTEDIAAVRQWIESGAPAAAAKAKARKFLSPQSMIDVMAKDVAAAGPRDRRYLRYFTITHLNNAGSADDELQSYRVGLSKLVNSLSWGRDVVVPKAVDAEQTVLRIDLRDYRWTEVLWDEILFHNPFGLEYGTDAERELRQATGSRLPYVRADWFVSAASVPPLYHDVLQLPKTDRELEDQLKVSVFENLRTERVARAGFNGSGVSRNNRLIERHESPYGAYWKSYDFSGNQREKNLFANPLGPGPNANQFRHDGGEIIFNLPNGMQAYLLVDARGRRIDKGPVDIVSDPKQPDRQVVNGLSCMSCHARGMIEKEDQVRAHVTANPTGFSEAERDRIRALYPVKDEFTRRLRGDAERFRTAVEATGAPLSATEPVAALARHFDEELDLKSVAAELGLQPATLTARLAKVPSVARIMGSVTTPGGTLQRAVLADQVLLSAATLGAGRPIAQCRAQVPGSVPTKTATELMLEDTGGLGVMAPEKSKAAGSVVRLRRYRDLGRKLWVYVSDSGHLAVLPDDRPAGKVRELRNIFFSDHRRPGDKPNDKQPDNLTITTVHDTVADALLYVSNAGGIAVTRAKPPNGKLTADRRIGVFNFHVRPAGTEFFAVDQPVVHVDVYRDQAIGQFLYVTDAGALTLASTAPEMRRSRTPHGYRLAARTFQQALLAGNAASFGIDVKEIPGSQLSLWLGSAGSVAVARDVPRAQVTTAPVLVQRLKLQPASPVDPKTSAADRARSVEVYRDGNTGQLIFLAESGHFAVTPTKN